MKTRWALGVMAGLALNGALRAQPAPVPAPPSLSDLAWWQSLGRIAVALPADTPLSMVICIDADPRLRWVGAGISTKDERKTEDLRTRMEICAANDRALQQNATHAEARTRLVAQLRAAMQERAKRLDSLSRALTRCLQNTPAAGADLDALLTCLQSWTGEPLSDEQRRIVRLMLTSPPAASPAPQPPGAQRQPTAAGSSAP